MDYKRLIPTVVLIVGLAVAYWLTLNHYYRLHPEWAQTPAPVPTTTEAAPSASATTQSAGNGPPTVATTGPVAGFAAVPADHADAATVGSERSQDPTYALALAIDPQGAGLSSVLLNDFYDTAEHKVPYRFQQPLGGVENDTRPLATRTVTINDKPVDLSSVTWARTAMTPASATYVAKVNEDGKPALELTKTFTVQPRSASAAKGYEVLVNQSVKNVGGRNLKVQVTTNGPAMPTRENERSDDRRYVAGFNDGDDFVKSASTFVSELSKGKSAKDLVQLEPTLPLLWVGACNSYFDAIVRPDYAGNPKPSSAVRLAAAPALGQNDENRDSSLSLESSSFDLAPGQATPFDLHVFFGPKERALLKDGGAFYAAYPRMYDQTLVYTGGFCGFLTFTWLINLLYWILAAFHFVTRDWGLAIIGLVCLVRGLLHPITKRAQVNMMQMGKFSPELERLKKKYGDDKEAYAKAQAQVVKERGLAPLLGCLPMFLQMPIWLALWATLQSTFALRQAPFLRFGPVHLTWIKDLSHPDQLINFGTTFYPLSLFGIQAIHFSAINILPLLLAVAYFVTQVLQPAPANVTPEQEQMRKTTRYTSLLVPIFFYSGPSGLTLYMLCSSVIGMVEAKIIRDHIKQRDAAEKSGQILVDAPTTTKVPAAAGGRRFASPTSRGGVSAKPQANGLLAKLFTRVTGGSFADLLAKIQDEYQKEQQRQKKKRA